MSRQRAEEVIRNLFCTVPELRPDLWDFVEPARRRFDVNDVVNALAAPEPRALSTKPFFLRKSRPSFRTSVRFQNGPASRPCHNGLAIDLDSPWEGGELQLARIVSGVLAPEFPDYAYVASAPKQDQERFNELRRPLTQAELMAVPRRAPPFIVAPPATGRISDAPLAWFHPIPDFMLGPGGFLWDIAWFNFFGRPYVELIGGQRIRAAGWARVEEVGNGLGCYATERIDDPDSFDRRARIRDALAEFVWTPGCKREDKKAPVFDFSQQIAAAPQTGTPSLLAGTQLIDFAGVTEEEKRQAIEAIEKQTGRVYDTDRGMLLPEE
jgi:hypothetical protein